MERPSAEAPKRALEPVTESFIKLLLWLSGPPRRTGAMLAKACGYSQQRLSFILCRQSRPGPDSELAQLLSLATEGQVSPEGWLLPHEARDRAERRARAAELGRRYASGEEPAAPQGRPRNQDLGDLGRGLDPAPAPEGTGEVAPPRAHRGRRRPVALRSSSTEPPTAAFPALALDRSAVAHIGTELLIAELAARLAQHPGCNDAGKGAGW